MSRRWSPHNVSASSTRWGVTYLSWSATRGPGCPVGVRGRAGRAHWGGPRLRSGVRAGQHGRVADDGRAGMRRPRPGRHRRRGVRPELLPSVARQAAYWGDYGRVLARLRGRRVGVAPCREDLFPARVHRHPFTRDTVAELVARTPRDSPLDGSCGRWPTGPGYPSNLSPPVGRCCQVWQPTPWDRDHGWRGERARPCGPALAVPAYLVALAAVVLLVIRRSALPGARLCPRRGAGTR